MIALIQRVSQASVSIGGQVHAQISNGFLVFLGISTTDTASDLEYICNKIIGLRVFADADQKMNLNLKDVNGDILLVSQFTLHAMTKKGNRPSFIEAARPELAIPLYEQTIQNLNSKLGKSIKTGVFGADMQVSLVNDGPVTISIDSQNRK